MVTNKHKTLKNTISGILYTLYNIDDRGLKIGFTHDIRKVRAIDNDQKFSLIGHRNGSFKEFFILKLTLKELGYNKESGGSYLFSNQLVKHLQTLNWPVGINNFNRNQRKKLKIF